MLHSRRGSFCSLNLLGSNMKFKRSKKGITNQDLKVLNNYSEVSVLDEY
jgi:hypothetical protein